MKRHKVLIIGGGFAGLSAARALRKAPADVTLVDRRNFHVFQPLLYQVATGSLSPSDISSPLRMVFSRQKNVRVLLGEAVRFDTRRQLVTLADGLEIEYDSLIVATIIRMAHSLRLKVIAEGVEGSEQLATLRAQGCDEIQGYHLSRPLPADALEEFVRERFAA